MKQKPYNQRPLIDKLKVEKDLPLFGESGAAERNNVSRGFARWVNQKLRERKRRGKNKWVTEQTMH